MPSARPWQLKQATTGRGMPRPVRLRLSPATVWSANWDGLVAAAVARCRRALLLEALPAVHRLVVARLEGDFGLLATGRAHCRVHLARSGRIPTAAARGVTTTTAGISAAGIATATATAAGVAARGATAVVTAGRALSLALRPAIGATLRLGVTALLVERLLSGRKSECLAAIATGDRLIGQLAVTSLAYDVLVTLRIQNLMNG